MRYGSRRRRRGNRVGWGVLSVALAGVGVWWWAAGRISKVETPGSPVLTDSAATNATEFAGGAEAAIPKTALKPENAPASASPLVEERDEPHSRVLAAVEPPADDPARNNPVQPAADRSVQSRTPAATPVFGVGADAIESAWKRYQSADKIAARHELNALLAKSTSSDEQRRLREYLSKIADETIFSPSRAPNDPLVDEYVVQAGDAPVKIAKKTGLTHELIMRMNNISDAGRLRLNQKLKIVRGPFHAKISKRDFRIDVYLQDLYVRSYRVGLGADPGTPEGVWKVKEKLTNPTFYPPASFSEKRVIAADDPKNPLGEHWIGLEGLEGDAHGHDGYGIHGTIEPDSIGKAVSHGCVRMNNDDVAVVYSLLTSGQSTVTVLP